MKQIEVVKINLEYDATAHRTAMSLAAYISKHGQELKSPADIHGISDVGMLNCEDEKTKRLVSLPHSTLQKFTTLTFLFLNVSRRFLAQITRHQNEIKFMVSSFRQADHSADASCLIPIEVSRHGYVEPFQRAYEAAMEEYRTQVPNVGRDAAGYLLPQATRCTILASATAYEWKHIIRQRTCRRCSNEMQYTMLRLWEHLYRMDPVMFSPETTGPNCLSRMGCEELENSCGANFSLDINPHDLLKISFPELMEEPEDEHSAKV